MKTKFKLHIFVLGFVGISLNAFGQNMQDSLMNLISSYRSTCNENCLDDSVKVNYLNKLAISYRNSDPDTAVYYSSQALRLSTKIKWTKGIGQSNNQLGVFLQTLTKFDMAMSHLDSALVAWNQLEKEIPDSLKSYLFERKGAAYSNKAMVYSDLGQFQESTRSFNQAMNYYDRAGVTSPKAIAILNYGYLYKKQGYYSVALKQYFLALPLFEAAENMQGIANTHHNIGEVYRSQKLYDQAMQHYLKTLEISSRESIYKLKIASLFQLGNIHFEQNHLDSAKLYYDKTFTELKEYDDPQLYNANLIQVGAVYLKQKDYSNARLFTLNGIAGSDSIGDIYNVMLAKHQLGQIYFAELKLVDAEKYYKEALALAYELNSMHDLIIINQSLTELYKKSGNLNKALEHFEIASQYNDSIFTTSKAAEIKNAEKQYEFDKTITALNVEQEKKAIVSKNEIERQKLIKNGFAGGAIILLLSAIFSFFFYKRKRDAEQKQKETFHNLQVSETEMKALRSQMNPHFIFNALQSIQTFLIKHKPDEANMYLLKFSKLMRAVLENSLQSEVSLKKDIQALELYMQLESIRLPHPFTYYFHLDESIDQETAQIPPLILQPFVENAIWHGLQHKNEPGHIDIYIKKNESGLLATVEDNGVGRDMSRKVTQPMLMKKESLGMKLTEERLNILNNQKKIKAGFKITDLFSNNNQAAGTRIDLVLPAAF